MNFFAGLNFTTIMLIALTTVGIIEAIKKALDKINEPAWMWPIVMIAVSIGVGFSTLIPALFVGLQGAAFAQLTYPLLVKLPSVIIDKIKG